MVVSKKLNALALMFFCAAAIFLTAAPAHAQAPAPGTDIIAINCGGGEEGPYVADTDFSGGGSASVTNTITTSGLYNPAPQDVYNSYRNANPTYKSRLAGRPTISFNRSSSHNVLQG
jgi:hypothetical protein